MKKKISFAEFEALVKSWSREELEESYIQAMGGLLVLVPELEFTDRKIKDIVIVTEKVTHSLQ